MSSVCCKQPKPPNKRTRERDEPSFGYQIGHAITSLLVRLSVIFIVITSVVSITVGAQILSYHDQNERKHHCSSYVSCQMILPVDNESCVDYFRNGTVLNDDGAIRQMSLQAWWSSPNEPNHSIGCHDEYQEDVDTDHNRNIFSIVGFGLLGISLSMCIFLPCFGVNNIVLVAAWAGPVLVLASTVSVMQYAIFGPVTGNAHGAMGSFNHDTWHSMVSKCLILNLPILIMYEELRSTLHYYYKHCIQKNFFMNGSDVRIGELAKDFYHRNKTEEKSYEYYNYGAEDGKLSGSSYCPLLMVTATSSDYESPGDTDTIAEVSISPLHTGGEETHYVRTPRSRSLAKCTALTGAGCLDAITLSMQSNKLYLRFWLEALNLSWGDYLLHNTKKSPLNAIAEKIFDNMPARWVFEDFVIRLTHRAAGGFLWFIAFALVLIGWWDMSGTESHFIGYLNKDSCEEAAHFFRIAGILALIMVTTAFCSFLPFFEVLSLSSISRLLLQLTMYKYVGKYPPRLLYCTDGGVQDCTGLVQMMRRQLPKIFLVLAGADPTDELIILRMAIDCAERERVGSFYDPANPKRDFRLMLEEYQEELKEGHQKSGSVMHIKICYGYRDVLGNSLGKKEPKYGDLFIIKNRLPAEGVSPIQPLITAEEIKTDLVTKTVPAWAKNKYNYDLGPFGCCDCCHGCCNFGPKFPHGTFTGYLYLSPMWFSSLSRLGFALSNKGIEEMDKQQA